MTSLVCVMSYCPFFIIYMLFACASVEKDVRVGRRSRRHGVTFEISDSVFAQNVLINEEMSGCAATVAHDNRMRCVGHDSGLAATAQRLGEKDFHGRAGNSGARPQ